MPSIVNLLNQTTCSHMTVIPNYVSREMITTSASRPQINITESTLSHVTGIPKETKALVVIARSQEVVKWMEDVRSDWTQYLYIVTEDVNSNGTLSVPADRGNEAMRYLSFIIDNYDSLPDIIAFRHGHNGSWHQAFDSAAEINNLNLTTVRSRGYQNFNCETSRWGCEQHIYLADKQEAEKAGNGETDGPLPGRSEPAVDAGIYEVWDSWFGIPMPQDVTSACCAQFVVMKAAVHGRPREKYIELRQWLINTTLADYDSGRVFERLWHVVFGMPPVDCESEDDCYCNVYTGPLTRTCPS